MGRGIGANAVATASRTVKPADLVNPEYLYLGRQTLVALQGACSCVSIMSVTLRSFIVRLSHNKVILEKLGLPTKILGRKLDVRPDFRRSADNWNSDLLCNRSAF